MSMLIHNAKIYVQRDHFADAILIEDGSIMAVGKCDQIVADYPQADIVYDAQGHTIIPGFNDSHLHLMNKGVALAAVDLAGAASIEEVIERGRRYIEENAIPAGTLVHGMGWNQDYFTDEKRLLTRFDLDRISTEHPIIFERTCIHIIACNTLALERAGVSIDTPVNAGGAIDRDERGLTGILRENACIQVSYLLQNRSVEEKKSLVRRAIKHALQYGITSVQTCDLYPGTWPTTLQAFDEVLDETPHLRVYHQFNGLTSDDVHAFCQAGHRTGSGTDFNRIGPLKVFVDGSLGARTAALRQSYHDDPMTQGILTLDRQQLDELLAVALHYDCSMIAHAIGDRAVETVLDAFEGACEDGVNPKRLGVVHVQITDPELLQRFAKMGAVAYVQPIFLDYDIGIVADRVGEELASTSYAFGTLRDQGVHVAFGTDSPVEDMNPFDNLYCAVTRQRKNGEPVGGYGPNERFDMMQAIDAYTLEGAYCEFEENRKGRLLPGYVADLVVLNQDLFTIAPDEIRQTKVLATMVNGRWVYER